MKKLNIDLEFIVQSASFNEDDLGKEYLDTKTGDVINIPYDVNEVVEGRKKEEELEEWQFGFLEEAYAVKENKDERYFIIPSIEESYIYGAMVEFAREKVTSESVRENLLQALKENESIRNFKNTIFKYEDEIDKWQDYEIEKYKEYMLKWLKGINIEIE